MFGENNLKNGVMFNFWFVVIPCLMIFLVYMIPYYSGIWVVVCLLILVLFIVHLYVNKRKNFLLVAAIVPNTIGPIVSGFIFDLHKIPTTQESELLVGYAFHISAVLVLILYVLLNVDRSIILKVCIVGVLYLAGNIALSSPYTVWYTGPELFFDVSAPPVSPLFLGRVILTVLCAYVALNHYEKREEVFY